MNLEEKLANINPNSFEKRSAELIRQWKDRVPQLSALKDFINHPVAQELANQAFEGYSSGIGPIWEIFLESIPSS